MEERKAIAFSVIVILAIVNFSGVNTPRTSASTNVSGVITTDTVWTLAISPIIIDNDVLVQSGITLTIEAGVEVRFNDGTSIIVDGILNALGTPSSQITFTSNSLTPVKGIWSSINARSGGSHTYQWVKLEYSTNGIQNNCNISQSVFVNNTNAVKGSSLNVTDSSFSSNTNGVSGDGIINSCTFQLNDIGASGYDLNIKHSNFTLNNQAIDGFSFLQECQIHENGNGVSFTYGSGQVLNCNITHNTNYGITMRGGSIISDSNITDNGGAGIIGTLESGSEIYRCNISNNGGFGVSLIDIIEDTIIANNDGLGVDSLQERMLNTKVFNNGAGGVYARDVMNEGNILIENSEITDNNGFGIKLSVIADSMQHHTISDCTIENNLGSGIVAQRAREQYRGGDLRVYDTIINNNGKCGINGTTPWGGDGSFILIMAIPELINTTITNHEVGIIGGNVNVFNSSINDNSEIGLELHGSRGEVNYNNIYNNGIYNVKTNLIYGNNINAMNNWWGTTDETIIEDKIFDYYDDFYFGEVIYKPYRSTSYPKLFEDGFETGDFSLWTGTTITTGETTTISTDDKHHGSYSTLCTSNGDGIFERAYSYKNIDPYNELFARGYVQVVQTGIADNMDRHYFTILKAGGNSVAFAGWRMNKGVIHWNLLLRDGTGWASYYSTSTPQLGQWYSVELHWIKDSTQGGGELYVDGQLVCSAWGLNTAALGDINSVRFGLAEAVNCGPITLLGDCFVLSETYVGPEDVETRSLNILVSGGGSTSPAAGLHNYLLDTPVSVTATPSAEWAFNHLVLDSVDVGSGNPIQVLMDADHELNAVFTVVQIPAHDVFSVISNSTVTDLVFDSSSKILSFIVSGPDGTLGFVNVTISKELVADTTGMEVLLDGVEIPYDVFSIEDSWLLSFSYQHSQHRVYIRLEGVSDLSINPNFLNIVMLSVLFFIIITCVYRTRN